MFVAPLIGLAAEALGAESLAAGAAGVAETAANAGAASASTFTAAEAVGGESAFSEVGNFFKTQNASFAQAAKRTQQGVQLQQGARVVSRIFSPKSRTHQHRQHFASAVGNVGNLRGTVGAHDLIGGLLVGLGEVDHVTTQNSLRRFSTKITAPMNGVQKGLARTLMSFEPGQPTDFVTITDAYHKTSENVPNKFSDLKNLKSLPATVSERLTSHLDVELDPIHVGGPLKIPNKIDTLGVDAVHAKNVMTAFDLLTSQEWSTSNPEHSSSGGRTLNLDGRERRDSAGNPISMIPIAMGMRNQNADLYLGVGGEIGRDPSYTRQAPTSRLILSEPYAFIE